MKKWLYALVAVILIFSLAVVLWYCYHSYGRYGHGRDEACIKETLKSYSGNVEKFQNDLRQRKQQLDLEFVKSASSISHPPISVPTPIFNIPIISIVLLEQLLRQLECTAMPMPVKYDNSITDYPVDGLTKPLPYPCDQKPILYQAQYIPKLQAIQGMVPSVGRIEIRNVKSDPKKIAPVMLGSGFLIAPGTFAVSCHVIAPLLNLHADLQLDDPEKLVVDFEPTRFSYNPDKEFAVTGFLGCSQRNGLDVALLDICGRSDPSKPEVPCKDPYRREKQDPLLLLLGAPDDINKTIKDEFSVLIGYADLDHFIDPVKRAIYDPFVAYSYSKGGSSAKTHSSSKPDSQPNPNAIYGKFLLIDGVENEDDCDKDSGGKGLDIVLDTVSTTVGESGSVVIDLHEPVFSAETKFDKRTGWKVSDKHPVVVGMHTCCSTYFEDDYGEPPHAKLPCAQLHRTFHNQDVSSWSILNDSALCPILRDRGVVVVDINDKPINPLVCH